MYVCIHACMHVCMYIYIHIWHIVFKDKDPAALQTMISGIPVVLGLRAKKCDPYLYVVCGVPMGRQS